jgi:hypothetical protein
MSPPRWSSLRAFAALALSLVLIVDGVACFTTSVRKVEPEGATPGPEEQIVGVTTNDGAEVSFDPPGASIENDRLVGNSGKRRKEIPLTSVQRIWLGHRKFSTVKTVLLVVGIVGVGIGIALAAKGSCPFVYSWDGEKYIFDAEPYGGAITWGLERDDYTQLDELRAVDGVYRLRISNEVDETQFTNLAELWVVDHPRGTRVVPDEEGTLHAIAAPQPLLVARDRAGRDLRTWLDASDRRIWEPQPPLEPGVELRDEIVMTFPRPAGASRARLVANVATGLWGSYMIKTMLEARGRELPSWYAAVDERGTEAERVFAWSLREELYTLKIEVEEPTGWETRGLLSGVGPFISKDRVVALNVSRVRGETLRIRIRPPRGFWALNSFAVDYGADRPVEKQVVRPSEAVDSVRGDVLRDLSGENGRYYAMPRVGDRADLKFTAPAKRAGLERTVLLHSRGYYRLHLRGEGDPNRPLLAQIESEPGGAARFAAESFARWRQERAAAR